MSAYNESKSTVTINTLVNMKQRCEKIACLTAYDASFAALIEDAGVDVVLVGDSLGMVIQGYDSTLPVTMDEMIYHTKAVSRACRRVLLMADMPFLSYTSPAEALKNAARLMKEAGAQMVKLESSTAQAEVIKRLADEGIPVCAHIGLRPQSVFKLGGYRVQGKETRSAELMKQEARVFEQAGADVILLECVPADLAADITRAAGVPVIGIGAGPHCDGQILVLYDILAISRGKRPRFSEDFMQDSPSIKAAINAYAEAVKSGDFPREEHCF